MAVPKRRTSRQRKRKRRTHYRAEIRPFQPCPRCGGPRLSHRACPNCGYYKDHQVLKVES